MADLTHLMFWAVIGHLVGDYLLQNKWMALNKNEKGWYGIGICTAHSLIYSIAVTLVVGIYLWGFAPYGIRVWAILTMVFLTHYPIDRWSLADKWLKLIRGRQLDEVFKEADLRHLNGMALPNPPGHMTQVANVATQQSFTALAYAVADNTTHFLLMTAGFAALLNLGVLP